MKKENPPREHWKEKYEHTQGLLKLCHDGNDLLRMQKEEFERALEAMRLEKNAAIKEYADCQRELIAMRVESNEVPYRESGTLWGMVMCMVCFLLSATVISWALLEWAYLRKPIMAPYVVYRPEVNTADFKACQNMVTIYRERTQKAWRILEHHHGGPITGQAFAVLDGQKN